MAACVEGTCAIGEFASHTPRTSFGLDHTHCAEGAFAVGRVGVREEDRVEARHVGLDAALHHALEPLDGLLHFGGASVRDLQCTQCLTVSGHWVGTGH
jgi:hypothetical protein